MTETPETTAGSCNQNNLVGILTAILTPLPPAGAWIDGDLTADGESITTCVWDPSTGVLFEMQSGSSSFAEGSRRTQGWTTRNPAGGAGGIVSGAGGVTITSGSPASPVSPDPLIARTR